MIDFETFRQQVIDDYNNQEGNLTGYDCVVCKNKGFIKYIQNGYLYTRECDCMVIRRAMRLIEKSGLANKIEMFCFDNFKCTSSWQLQVFTKAKEYSSAPKGWFALLGQSGAGKTHLCTAICNEFLQKGVPVKYMLWVDESNHLKQIITDGEEYARTMFEYKNIPVLYIDDLFKSQPTPADIKLAFEILNYRYMRDNLITIITSEMLLNDFPDEAIAGRIKQKCGDNIFELVGKEKNFRFNGGGVN